MQSLNFEFLRPAAPDLAELGGFAEAYAHPDPSSAAVKLRTLAERIVTSMYSDNGLRLPEKPSLNDLIRDPAFARQVPRPVLYKLDAIRINGNKAAHGEPVTPDTSLWMLRECHAVGAWYYLTYLAGEKAQIPLYAPPPPGGVAAVSAAEREAKLETLLRELDEVKAQVAAARNAPREARRSYQLRVPAVEGYEEVRLRQLAAEERAAYEAKESPEANRVEKQSWVRKAPSGVQATFGIRHSQPVRGQDIARELGFDEDTARQQLIDIQLVQAGWSVGPHGASTDEVGKDVEIQHQPTDSGLAYADYVLWDDNRKPLAVVQVGKAGEQVAELQVQARNHADGLEKMTGQRPVIFLTNGSVFLIWDAAQSVLSERIFEFHSKDRLRHLVYTRDSDKVLQDMTRPDSIAPVPGRASS